MADCWAIMALESEAPSLALHPRIRISGLGKINAAITAADIILEHRPNMIINIGTAGGVTVGPGLYEPKKFFQRDMRCEVLGHNRGHTPFETEPAMIDLGAGLICGTGDDFVTDSSDLADLCDLVDMESYAIAKACRRWNTEFVCYKWVSDLADANSAQDWQQQVRAGEKAFVDRLHAHGF